MPFVQYQAVHRPALRNPAYHRIAPLKATAMASHILLSETNSNVTLKVRQEGYSWRMPAHSLILVTKSSAFREMLEERAEEDSPTPLSIVDMRPETAGAVLKYLYNDEYPTKVTADLLIASQKYNLLPLRENLEERFMADMTVRQACVVLEELHQRQPAQLDCAMKCAAQDMLQTHALTVFGSDLIMLFSKRTLEALLQSNHLNIPDDALVFWGIWRWGRRECSKHDRSLTDNSVASYIDDLIVHVRHCAVKSRKGIPSVALCRFDRCRGRRNMYLTPRDILQHTSTLRLTPSWEDLIPSKMSEEGDILCAQLSFENDVMLVGMVLEGCPNEQNKVKVESHVRITREIDGVEIRRQTICWLLTKLRRTSLKCDPERRLEAELVLLQPVFLSAGNMYSIYIHGNFTNLALSWSSIPERRQKVGHTFVNLHADGVTAVRDVYLIPDMSITWGPRGPDV